MTRPPQTKLPTLSDPEHKEEQDIIIAGEEGSGPEKTQEERDFYSSQLEQFNRAAALSDQIADKGGTGGGSPGGSSGPLQPPREDPGGSSNLGHKKKAKVSLEEPLLRPDLGSTKARSQKWGLGFHLGRQAAPPSWPSRESDGVASVNLRIEEAIQDVSNVEKAATLIEQALHKRYMPPEVLHQRDCGKALKAFLLYHHLSALRLVVVLIFAFLPVVETPAWCHEPQPHPCGDPDVVVLSGIRYLSYHTTITIEAVCLVALAVLLRLQYAFLGWQGFKRRHVPVYETLLVGLNIADILIGLVFLHGLQAPVPARISPYLRIFLIIAFSKALRGCFRTVLRIVRNFIDVAFLLAVFILFSSWLAFVVFRHTAQGDVEFRTFPKTANALFVLLTTANNPNVWVLAFNAHRASFFFFAAYLIIGIYFLLNLNLSVIYSSYKSQMAAREEKQVTARHETLRTAFKLLDEGKRGYIHSSDLTSLLHSMESSRHLPDLKERTMDVFMALDRRGDFRIWAEEFEDICEVVSEEIILKPRRRAPIERHLSSIANLQLTQEVRSYMRTQQFDLLLSGTLAVALVFVVLETTLDDDDFRSVLLDIERGIGWVLVLETAIKVLLLEHAHFWESKLNCYDFFATVVISAVLVLEASPLSAYFPLTTIRYALVLRAARLVTILSYFNRWRAIAKTCVTLVPTVMPILGLQFIMCSFFSLVGVNLFGGAVYRGNPRLVPSLDYVSVDLLAFNYNDFASGMATNLCLCIVNNWFYFMDGITAAAGWVGGRAFFFVFYVIAVAFVLNVVVAFVLEVFVNEMESEERRSLRRPDRAPAAFTHSFSSAGQLRHSDM